MKRPAGVILTGVFQIVGSLVVLLFSVLFLFLPLILRNSPKPSPELPAVMIYGGAAVYGVFAVLGFLTAIGLFRLRSWARYSTLIFAGILTASGLLMALAFAVMPMVTPSGAAQTVPPGAVDVARITMIAISLSFALLGVLWLYYFNRAKTKLAFVRNNGETTGVGTGVLIGGQRVPVSIVVIAVLYLIGGAFGLAMSFWVPANIFLGIIATGVSAKLLTLVLALAGIYIGVGLLRLSENSRLLAVGMGCFHLINILVMALMPGTMRNYLAQYSAWMNLTPQAQQLAMTGPIMRWSFAIGLVSQLVLLYFLVTRAEAFRRGSRKTDETAVA
jgi:hypothetical protein